MTAVATPAGIQTIQIPKRYGPVWLSEKPYQIWYGSRFSAKSWTKAIYFLLKAQSSPYFRLVFARDTQKNVRLSQYQLFKDICRRFPFFRDKFTFLDSNMKVICNQNGNFMVGGSFEQPDTLRSTAEVTDFWAEEPITREAQIGREDFLDIAGSLRNAEGIPTQFHFTFNPISKETWIYKDFFETKIYGDDVEILKINWYHNPYCPEDRKAFLNRLKKTDPKRYEVDGEGEWGVAHEGRIYKHYVSVDEMPEPQFYGVDFGFTHPMAIVAGAVVDVPDNLKNDLYWKELLYKTELSESDMIRECERLKLRKDIPMICDNESPSFIKALRRAGYRAKPCVKYAGSVWDGINAVLNHNLKIVKGSDNLFREASTYMWDQNRDGSIREEPVSNSEDHGLDAGRYGLEAKTRKKGSFFSE